MGAARGQVSLQSGAYSAAAVDSISNGAEAPNKGGNIRRQTWVIGEFHLASSTLPPRQDPLRLFIRADKRRADEIGSGGGGGLVRGTGGVGRAAAHYINTHQAHRRGPWKMTVSTPGKAALLALNVRSRRQRSACGRRVNRSLMKNKRRGSGTAQGRRSNLITGSGSLGPTDRGYKGHSSLPLAVALG